MTQYDNTGLHYIFSDVPNLAQLIYLLCLFIIHIHVKNLFMNAYLHTCMYLIIYLSTQLLSTSFHNVYTYSYVFVYLFIQFYNFPLLKQLLLQTIHSISIPLLYIFACTASYQSLAGMLRHTRHCLLALPFPEIYIKKVLRWDLPFARGRGGCPAFI